MIHIGASVITAVLTVAEKEKIPSENVLRGIVMGYEAAVRCARAIQPGHKMRGYHVSGTCGTIGSAMGVAFACGYDKEQLKSTLACAVSSAAGVLEIQEDASELKPYNIGRAAMDGLFAAQMGGLALPGPDDILGGKRGFLTALTDTPHPEFLTDFTTEEYALEPPTETQAKVGQVGRLGQLGPAGASYPPSPRLRRACHDRRLFADRDRRLRGDQTTLVLHVLLVLPVLPGAESAVGGLPARQRCRTP